MAKKQISPKTPARVTPKKSEKVARRNGERSEAPAADSHEEKGNVPGEEVKMPERRVAAPTPPGAIVPKANPAEGDNSGLAEPNVPDGSHEEKAEEKKPAE